ncbi:phage tail tape measure protein [Lachnotalea glycerini]|uniref:Phage tail tape measure protein n=2 Tax=Lachnotalea glycerini TaxID=1763509 RepID=A0A371JCB5_9FIRM|nr:phage tail tape measure protein [Lachnotalea glycerini]
MAIKIAGEIENSFYNSTKLTKKELQAIAKTAASTSSTVDKSFRTGFDSVGTGFDKIENLAKKAFQVTAKVAMVAASAVTAVAAGAIQVGTAFEEQMSTVKALSGATDTEFNSLNEKAKELGENTKFSATEVGQAMEYMAMAGWKTSDMLGGLEGILNLAAASGEDLGSVSDIVTDALTAFGLKTSDSAHFADVLAAAATNSNTNVGMMGETFSYAAPLAGALGYSIEDTAIAIGLMANSGIKASAAGTNLRKIFAETTNGAKISAAAFGNMTIATTNTDGSMRDLKSIISDLRGSFSQMTESEKAINAESIAGKTAMSGLLAIVNASESDYDKLTEAIYNCQGAAEQMAEVRIDNLNGDVTLLKSGMEGLGIEIYEQMNTPLRDSVQGVTEFVGALNSKLKSTNIISNIATTIKNNIPTIKRELMDTGKAIYEFSEPFINVAKFILKNPDVIVSTLVGIGSALMSYKVAKGILGLVDSFKALGLVLTNPFAAAITAVALAIGGAAGIITHIKKANREMKKQNLAEHFGDIALSIEDLQEAAKNIIKTDAIEQVSNAISAFDDVESIVNSMKNSVSSLSKMNWKVSMGMELTKNEKNDYLSNIESFMQDAQAALEQKQYALNLSLNILTDDDAKGQGIRDQFNTFYSNSNEELTSLGAQLSETVNKAFEDDLLTIDEAKEIAELQRQISSITEKLASSEFDANMEVLGMKYAGGELDAESFQNLQGELQEQVSAATADLDEALKKAIASAKVQLSDGEIDSKQYETMVSEFKENYLEQVGTIELKASNFQTDTIMQQYAEELSTAMPEFNEKINDAFNLMMDNYENTGDMTYAFETLKMNLSNIDIDSTTKAALGDLYKQLQPSTENFENLKNKYAEYGMVIPQSISEGINNVEIIGALSGNMDSILHCASENLINNSEYSSILTKLEEQGEKIPEVLSNAMTENREVINQKSNVLYNNVGQDLQTQFNAGFDISVPVNLNYATLHNANAVSNSSLKGIPGYANGGIITQPTLATFAEKTAEAAIPLDGSQKSISLWKTAGEMLGVYSDYNALSKEDSFSSLSDGLEAAETTNYNSQSGAHITYSPTLQFYGGTPNKQDIVEAGKMSQDEFNLMMQRYEKDIGRLCFT